MIAKDLIIASRTYSIKIIRQEKILRDHRLECPLPRDTRDPWGRLHLCDACAAARREHQLRGSAQEAALEPTARR
jgi:hypothetical protein